MNDVMRIYSIPVVSLFLLLGLQACRGHGDPADERLRHARNASGDIVIGAPWPWEARGNAGRYGDGLDMAVEEINGRGGLLGRPLRLRRVDDHESVNDGRVVAQSLVDDPDVVAVIGHLQSYVTIPAAALYDAGGMVLVAPFATSPELTQPERRLVFRTTFNDRQRGQRVAELAHRRGFRRMAVLYLRDAYGLDLANAFEQRAAELGLNVVDRQSYTPATDPMKTNFGMVLDTWEELEVDALFMAASIPEAAVFIAQARRAGIGVPIIGGDAMDAPALIAVGGDATEGTIIASSFHADEPRAAVRRFVERFRRRTGQDPDWTAAAGYDAVYVLARAIDQAGTTAAGPVAHALRTMPPLEGVTGTFRFDAQGDLAGRQVVAKVVRGGRFAYLASPEIPADLAAAKP